MKAFYDRRRHLFNKYRLDDGSTDYVQWLRDFADEVQRAPSDEAVLEALHRYQLTWVTA